MANPSLLKSVAAEIELSIEQGAGAKAMAAGQPLDTLVVAWDRTGGGALSDLNHNYALMQLRGFGKSRSDETRIDELNLAGYMADFDAAAAGIKSAAINLIAYSHGGYFATAYALHNPGAVKSLTLIEPALYTDRAELESRAELASQGKSVESVTQMLRYVDQTVGLDTNKAPAHAKNIVDHAQSSVTLAAEFRIRAENPISDSDLGRLSMPVLLIGGTASRTSSFVTRAASAIPFASVAWVRGATHLELMDAQHAPKISGAINSFLSGIS